MLVVTPVSQPVRRIATEYGVEQHSLILVALVLEETPDSQHVLRIATEYGVAQHILTVAEHV